MNRLRVRVRGPAGRVRQAYVTLEHGATIGEDGTADALFPGAKLELKRDTDGWSLAGHPLSVGRALSFRFGDVAVEVLPEVEHAPRSRWGDPALLVVLLGLVLVLATLEAVRRAAG